MNRATKGKDQAFIGNLYFQPIESVIVLFFGTFLLCVQIVSLQVFLSQVNTSTWAVGIFPLSCLALLFLASSLYSFCWIVFISIHSNIDKIFPVLQENLCPHPAVPQLLPHTAVLFECKTSQKMYASLLLLNPLLTFRLSPCPIRLGPPPKTTLIEVTSDLHNAKSLINSKSSF